MILFNKNYKAVFKFNNNLKLTNMNKNKIIDIGQFSSLSAFVSFLIGTFFFVRYYFFDIESCIYGGFIFLLFSIIANAVIALQLLYFLITIKKYRVYLTKKMLIMLANIPIAMLYYALATTKIISKSPF